MDLIDDDAPGPGGNAPEFTVSELSGAVKRAVEQGFSHVRVRGEVSRVSRPRSGHIYLDLKDDRSVLSAVVWKGQAARLKVDPEEGLEVIATGRLTTFPGQSKYQMVIEDMAPAGVGALMAMLEKRKAALEAEGLFAPGRKKPLPYLPEVIGVITSPSGAVIRDILHRLRERFPRKVLIWPVAVQGTACAPEVARAIVGFNRLTPGGALPRPDVLIVARGGGSVEDLWGFNEEIVVRAAAASQIPLISAVGHETDTTLIDHAADRRAPTPTAAAEIAVPVRLELLATLDGLGARLARGSAQAVGLRRQRLRDLARALPRPETLAESARQRLDVTGDRLPRALRTLVQGRRALLREAGAGLQPRVLTGRLRQDRTRVTQAAVRLPGALSLQVRQGRRALDARAARLSLRPILRDTTRARRSLDDLARRLEAAQTQRTAALRDRLDALDRLRLSFGHDQVLARGFVLVRDAAGHLVTARDIAATHATLDLEFADGRLTVLPGDAPATPPKRKPARKKPAQGSLFDE